MSKKLPGLLLVILTYTVCNILMFTINGVCWDDCLIWGASRDTYEYYFGLDSCNNIIEYWYQTAILDNLSLRAQLVAFRLIAFGCGLLSAMAVWLLTRKLLTNKTAALYVSLLFAACSVNRTGMMISCLHYAISNMLVLWGMVAIAYDYYEDNVWLRVAAALLWLFALLLWRSAVLLIPAIIVVICCFKTDFRWNRIRSYCDVLSYAFKKYWMVIFACLIYAVSFLTWAHPQSFVGDYTTILLKNVLLSPITASMTSLHIFTLYLAVLFEAFSFGDSLLSLIPLIFVAVFCAFFMKEGTVLINSEKRLLVLAVVFMLAGIWPQMLIKRVIYTIDIYTEASRIASLMPLPIAFVFVCIMSHCSPKFGKILMAVVLSSSVCYSISVYMDYEQGQQKNMAIAEYFKENPCLKGETVFIKDYSASLNSFPGSYMRAYEYESLSAREYGDKNAVKVRLNSPADSDYQIFIENGEMLYGRYKMFLYKYIEPEKYKEAIRLMLNIRMETK